MQVCKAFILPLNFIIVKHNALPTEKAIKRNLKIDNLFRLRRNNDRVFKKCPSILSILMRSEGYTNEDIFNIRNDKISKLQRINLYNTFRK